MKYPDIATRSLLGFGFLAALVTGICTTALILYFSTDILEAFFIAINVAAVTLMGVDKFSACSASSPRLPEIISYVIALLGGSPGTLLGMYVFKHKTRKAAFQFVLLLVFVAQLYVIRVISNDN